MNKMKLSYMDGMRGIAALFVVLSHYFQLFYPATLQSSKTLSHNGWDMFLGRTPINIIYNGNLAVCVFFVLSGYVLSYKFFETNGENSLIVSGAIRRYVRLCIPVFASVFIVYLLLLLDLFYLKDVLSLTKTQLLTDYDKMDKNFFSFLKGAMIDPFINWKTEYNPVLWTMTYELFGSFIVYSFLLLFGKVKRRYIFYFLAIFIMYDTYFVSFILGMALSDLFHSKNNVSDKLKKPFVSFFFLVLGIYLGTYPYIGTDGTIYQIVKNAVVNVNDSLKTDLNPFMISHIIGSFFIVLALVTSTTLKKIFSINIIAYFGEISFSMYLLHFTVMSSFSSYIFLKMSNKMSYDANFMVTFSLSSLIIVVSSHLFTKLIDNKAIKISRKVENIINPK